MLVETSSLFTYVEKKRGDKGWACVRPGAPSRLRGERTTPTLFELASRETLTAGTGGWNVTSPATRPRKG